MAMDREAGSPPPPMIGKIGPYTVFVTPPHTPKPAQSHSHSDPPRNIHSPPPVLPPPPHYPTSAHSPSHASSSFGFFWNALSKLHNVHSSLDESVAHWFGLNQSKYQWALDEYYESKGQKVDHVDGKSRDKSNKIESV